MYKYTDTAQLLYKEIKTTIQVQSISIQFTCIYVLNQQPAGSLQEQHEATKIQESKTKHMKLKIREYYKKQIQKEKQHKI
jgi:hypothetical protein